MNMFRHITIWMVYMNALQTLKALADDSRLRIVQLLQQMPYCVEDIAAKLDLAVSTVSAHLKKLQESNLVYVRRQQYYSMYYLNKEKLEMKLCELIPKSQEQAYDPAADLRSKVIKTYFEAGRLKRMPSQSKKRWVVYMEIIPLFEAGRSYSEQEVNDLIKSVFDDYCLIRRELVDEGVLHRIDGIYTFSHEFETKPGFFQRSWLESIGKKSDS